MATNIKVGQYILKKKIGEGAFAEVRLAEHATTGEEFAVKVFNRSALPRSDLERDVKREIKIMQYLRHPGIVSIHAALVTETKMYLVMELVRGGELYDEIVSKRRVDEKSARRYFQQIVDAMVYCHKRGVVHRDLKPENILLTDDGKIKITDFGMSWMKEAADSDGERKAKELLKTQCGTAKYMAPETIVRSSAGYDGEKVDAWECGMVLYALLAGYLPFNGEDDNSVFQSILRGKLRFPSHFSPGAKDVLRQLLEKDPAKRASLPQIREHLWFLVDYHGDPANTTKKSPALKKRHPASTAHVNHAGNVGRVSIGQIANGESVPNNGGEPSAQVRTETSETSSLPTGTGPEKTKLGQSFKNSRARSKSRNRISQRIRQGALAVVQDDNIGDVQLVKPIPRPGSVSQGVRFFGGTHPEDEMTTEEIVESDTTECPVPGKELETSTPSGMNEEEAVEEEAVEDKNPSAMLESRNEPESSSAMALDVPGADADSVGFRGKDATTTDRATPSPSSSPVSKKSARLGTAARKVPSLGVGAGFGTGLGSLFSGSRDSAVDESMNDVDDVTSPLSFSGRRKGPLTGMLRSMLSIDKLAMGSSSGASAATDEGPPLSEQSSWFATSPLTEKSSAGSTSERGPFRAEPRTADEGEGLVTSFKFRKRKLRGVQSATRTREGGEVGTAGS